MKARQIARWAATAVFLLSAHAGNAQPGGDFGGGFGGGMPPFPGEGFQRQQAARPDNKEAATRMTDEMKRSLLLTDKQYKKVYKLNLKWLDDRSTASTPAMASGSSAKGDRPMMGGPGGGEGDGFGMGTPPADQGRPDVPDRGERAQGAPLKEPSEEELAARNAKLQKVLTAEQYVKWRQSETNRRGQEHRGQTAKRFGQE